MTVNLAAVSESPITLLDCDVEEPNAHLFLKAQWEKIKRFTVPFPVFDPQKCDGCRTCQEACRFNAIAVFGTEPILFPELCHACGGCIRQCPTGAIREGTREIGSIRFATCEHISFVDGNLDIGEARSAPLIEEIRSLPTETEWILIDAPPGTSCPVIASVQDVDYVVLVTEPTPFGLHDLTLAVKMCRKMNLPCGVLLNRAGLGNTDMKAYCSREGIYLLGEIPFDRSIAEIYSRGDIPARVSPQYRSLFETLFMRIREEVRP